MNRSVFTKYIIAFAVIILISFLLLASIISSIINGYVTDSIREDVENTATVSSGVLEFNYHNSGEILAFETYIDRYQDAVRNLMAGVGGYGNDQILMITDSSGRILTGLRANEKDMPLTEVHAIPQDAMAVLKQEGCFEADGKLGGLFTQRYIVCAKTIESTDGTAVGAVFACSSAAIEGALVKVMNRTVIMASVWVMLAAMIAVYFISDRITSPLRSMTQAAKEFAHGKMDTRVEITGKDEISELAKAFNNMAESLQETEKMRNSFLANISHDLRTPMTTIAGFVDGMISGAIPPESQGQYLEIVSSEVHRLSRLVSQILDVSRLESGERKFTFARFDICETARLILISFEQKIDAKKLNVEFSCDEESMYAYGDSDATHQVLYNLCDNALKFSKEGGTLRVEIHHGDVGSLEVSVYNEGQGIKKEDLPYVFERFYKSDKSRGLDKTGVGLGLYIVKTILEALHETIRVESEPDQFCRFIFTLKEDKS